MRLTNEGLELTATDLVGHLNCHHLTELDRAVAEGSLARPYVHDPMLEILRERGSRHEQSYVDHLRDIGLECISIAGVDISDAAVAATQQAMRAGAAVIVQAALRHAQWRGRADVLRRVETPSALGSWSYEAIDTKLARETKAGAVLQLCVYSDLLGQVQGTIPERMHIVVPWSGYVPQTYRFADYAAYYRRAKRSLETSLAEGATKSYPEPNDHCEVCRWAARCEQRRRADDHLSLVAGISKTQMRELRRRNVNSLGQLAALPIPLQWKPDRGSAAALMRVREQARLQLEARDAGERRFELLPVEPGFGLACLPSPSAGDIFFDLEGDPFVGEHGLEYLFGFAWFDENGVLTYQAMWALNRSEEMAAFERFIDFVMQRLRKFPDLHVYHYAPYEPAAVKRLMGRYATREDEVDRMLRARLFVDLYGVVKHALRASVESYSIKKLEPFCGFVRATPLADANVALAELQARLELDDAPSIDEGLSSVIVGYNRDDCLAAHALREWLEQLRGDLVAGGVDVTRPAIAGDGSASEEISEWQEKVAAVSAVLTREIPDDPQVRTAEQHARWILANILDWHRREQKAVWWEYFRLAALSEDELLDERAGLAYLEFEGAAGGTKRAPIHRYRFPPQDTDLRGGEELRQSGGERLGELSRIAVDAGVIEIRKTGATAEIHPPAVFAHTLVRTDVLATALLRLAEHVAAHGIAGDGPYAAARALLLRRHPEIASGLLHLPGEATLDAALKVIRQMKGGVLPIQGPPGAGKTFTGARMICDLVRRGRKVGITANSHKVIRNLIDATIEAADELGIDLTCCQKSADANGDGGDSERLRIVSGNRELVDALNADAQVGAGTPWFWARPEVHGLVDVLFVDEAAQVALANVLAVSHAAPLLVLLGDPQQLDQPTQGLHPDGCGVSALEHLLDGRQTIDADAGLFLEETWRLHPDICAFTSELFYEGKLHARPELSKQSFSAAPLLRGSGLRYLPVPHVGNQSSSIEEAQLVAQLVSSILASAATWTDSRGMNRPVTLDDVLIIAPYNAQVGEIARLLPNARIGTVDKFQGQEAAIAIYSMATSSPADAPRGMEFLYSLNRFNVATSRARCLSILVASPELLDAECRTPRQIQLLNSFARYVEMAQPLGAYPEPESRA